MSSGKSGRCPHSHTRIRLTMRSLYEETAPACGPRSLFKRLPWPRRDRNFTRKITPNSEALTAHILTTARRTGAFRRNSLFPFDRKGISRND